MAVDLSNHNFHISEDVNQDRQVTPLDALIAINELNARNSANSRVAGESDNSAMKYDVNADGKLTPLDALRIINRLNGEGEGAFLTYTYTITAPTADATPATPTISQIAIGQDFQVNVFVQDTRDPATRPTIKIGQENRPIGGAFSLGSDLGVNRTDLATIDLANDIAFSDLYVNFSAAFQGGGISLRGQDDNPQISDGQTFSLTNTTGKVTFEFDTNSAVTSGNKAITLPALGGGEVYEYSTVANAMVTAINASSLGIAAAFNGESVVNIPASTVLAAETSTLTVSSTSSEFLDEVRGITGTASPPPNPMAVKRFYSATFSAVKAGTLTFTPTPSEGKQAVNGMYNGGDDPTQPGFDPQLAATPVSPDQLSLGLPFSISIILDPSGPQVSNDAFTITEDGKLTIDNAQLLANDTSGATPARTLTVQSIQKIGSTTGSLAGNVYTPAKDFNGQDLLTYTVTDTSGLTATGTITITVSPVNDAPVANNDTLNAVLGIDNNLAVLTNDTAGPTNESSQTIVVSAVGTASHGTVSIGPNGGSVVYTPTAGFVGTDTFTYTIRDNGTPQLTDTATVTVNVIPPTRPFAVPDTKTVAEDSSGNSIAVLSNDLTNTGKTALLVGIASNPAHGTVLINQNGTPADTSDDTIVYTPTKDFFGTDTFTYNMNESGGAGANSVGTVTVTVTNVNDTPVLANDLVQGAENDTLTIPFATLTANDSKGPNEDGQSLTITTVTAVTSGAGSIAINGTNVVYTPAPSFSGTFVFTYNARDNGTPALLAAAPATVTVNVNPFNDPPVLANDTVPGTEDVNVTIPVSTLLTNDSPGPGESAIQTLTVSSVAAVTANAGTVALVGSNVVYTPALNFNGAFRFTYTATDNGVPAKSGTATVTVNMAAVNDKPVATTDTVRAFKNNPLSLPVATLLANDTKGAANESSQSISVISVQGATNGTVSLDVANGVVLFTPATDFVGAASFTYTIQDNGGGTNTSTPGTVNVNVEEFQPSTIHGTAWIDETNDNLIDSKERGLGGLKVTLTGTTSLGQAVPAQTAVTLSDGTYEFKELGPGNYQVTFDAPIYAKASTYYANHSYSIDIAEPGGFDNVQNYAICGLNASLIKDLNKLMGQLVSQYQYSSGIALNGSYFAIGSDNSLLWGLKLDGFDDAIYTEAVFDGDNLLVTVVEADHTLHTAVVSNKFYRFIEDSDGNKLVRLIGSAQNFSWANTSLAAPAYTADHYLASIDALFEQRDW